MSEKFEIDFLVSHDEESVVAELRRVASLLGKQSIMKRDLDLHGRVSYIVVKKTFGTWRKGIVAAGLQPLRYTLASDEELLGRLVELWRITQQEHGRRPRVYEMQKYGVGASASLIATRFGTWKKALVKAAEMMGNAEEGEQFYAKARPRILGFRVRYQILKRDLYRCRACHRTGVELEVDHIVPVSLGGTTRFDNLQTLCRDCNRGKANGPE